MNEEGEYIKKTQCPFCEFSKISPQCMNVKSKNKCGDFRKKDNNQLNEGEK